MTAGRHVLLGTATGTVSGKIIDTEGNKHQVDIEGLIVPGLGHHLFSTSQAAKIGMTAIIGSRPRLDQNHHLLPLHQLNMNLKLLSIDLEIAEATENKIEMRWPSQRYEYRLTFATDEWDTLTPKV